MNQNLLTIYPINISNHLIPVLPFKIFISLWKLVFKLETVECKENRPANLKVIKALFRDFRSSITDTLRAESNIANKIAESGEPLQALCLFMSEFPEVFSIMPATVKPLIEAEINKKKELLLLCSFTSTSLQTHGVKIRDTYKGSVDQKFWKMFYYLSNTTEWHDLAIECASQRYFRSANFNDADNCFESCIKPYLKHMGLDQLRNLIQLIENEKDQTLYRKKASRDHLLIIKQIKSIDPNFNFSVFQKFAEIHSDII